MGKWTYSETRGSGGRFQVIVQAPRKAARDITYVRNAPVRVMDYSSSDPFGFASATLEFPMLTGFDDLGQSGELEWLSQDANIDIWWLPAEVDVSAEIIDPLTQKVTLDGFSTGAVRVFEGWMATVDGNGGDDGDALTVKALGALFQVDGYKAKPQYPNRPVPFEFLIGEQLDPQKRPHLRTRPMRIDWPAGWSKIVTSEQVANPNIYTPKSISVGDKWTGYTTRQTGSWDASLTSFVQDLLAVMFIDDTSGVTPGNQWTLTCDPGRQPVMRIRDRFRTPDFSVQYGSVGVKVSWSRDFTQRTDMVYGEGVGIDGVNWRNAAISADGQRTDFVPLVASGDAWPADSSTNLILDSSKIIRESFTKFAPGISQAQAGIAAGKLLARDRNAGLTGTLKLDVDPSSGMSRWLIKAGMSVRVKNLLGTGEEGVVFHINEAVCNPEDGTVTCKIDTKFRDLLTFEEAVARNRDPLLPSRLLQINRRSVMIEDQLAPWDYGAGSGFLPRKSTGWFRDKAPGDLFPWPKQALKYQPGAYPEYYVQVNANSSLRADRWTIVPVLMGEKGTIRRIEVAAYDRYGAPAPVEFHLSLYTVNVVAWDMPYDGLGPSPFIENAFQSTTDTGAPLPDGAFLTADNSILIGWGDSDQPAGYSPGSKSDGHVLTGQLIDDSTWTFDFSSNPEFETWAAAGTKQPDSSFTGYAAFYCEWTEPVYFVGRIYRQDQGTA